MVKITSITHVSVFWMAVVIASTPFATLSQQELPRDEGHAVTAEDSGDLHLDAKNAAEPDAERDFKLMKWFGGVYVSVVVLPLLVL